MSSRAIFNALAAGMIGGALAGYAVPGFISDTKRAYQEAYDRSYSEAYKLAYAREMNKPHSVPRTDGPGMFSMYQDMQNDVAVTVFTNAAGQVDRDNGPAVTVETVKTHAVLECAWYKAGKLHRENGPAVVDYDPDTGAVISADWYYQGQKTNAWQRASLTIAAPPPSRG